MRSILIVWGLIAGTAWGQDGTLLRSQPAESSLRYRVEHPFNTVHATSREADCRFWLAPDTTVTGAECSVPVRSFDSGNSLRDSHAMDAVEADRFPEAEFTAQSITPVEGRLGDYEILGSLTFHGQTREIKVIATPELKEDSLVVSGKLPIRLTEFGVDRPSLLFIPVRDEVRISFRLVFLRP